ncbi:ATP-binding cassette domain-containing protein [Oceanotoga sp. DSM 15011]|nr:ATP-binding cassette domain-containing protein [Oceanotoga teriensis]UYP01450.1 ATP-binding cassette domain-containing protein [Oceanotoga sp. DSM 15011]
MGLVGESGCGKSTTGMSILRLYDPTEGRISLEGQDTTTWFMKNNQANKYINEYYVKRFEKLKMELKTEDEVIKKLESKVDINNAEIYFKEGFHGLKKLHRDNLKEKRKIFRKDTQIIFQDPYSSLNPRMRIKNIISEGVTTHNLAKGKDVSNIVTDLLEKVGLSKDYIYRYPHQFSGGQRQRIGIARALALNPKIIVADESVSALDVSVQSQVINLMDDLRKEFDLTYIFIAHDLAVVKHISDRIAVMYLGKIAELTTKKELFSKPLHPYTVSLMSAIPVPDPEHKKKRIILQGDVPSPLNPPSGCRFHTRCPIAKDICKKEEPKLIEKEPGHFVSCHFSGEFNG